MIAAPTYSYSRPMMTPSITPGANRYAQPFAPFLSSLEVATRHITAARNILTGPQLMHQTIGQVMQSSIAQAFEGLAALNLAVKQSAPSEALAAAHQARVTLSAVTKLSLRATIGPDATPMLVNAFNEALTSIHDARSMATLYRSK